MASLVGDIQRQFGRKVFVTTFSVTNSATLFAIPATTTELSLPVPKYGACFMLQASVDILYRLSNGAAAGASTTNATKVLANAQELTDRLLADSNFDIVTASGNGVANLFLLVPGA